MFLRKMQVKVLQIKKLEKVQVFVCQQKYALKISENLTVFWCSQGVKKGCIVNEWVNLYVVKIVTSFKYMGFKTFFILMQYLPNRSMLMWASRFWHQCYGHTIREMYILTVKVKAYLKKQIGHTELSLRFSCPQNTLF